MKTDTTDRRLQIPGSGDRCGTVSVVIPARNEAGAIERCVKTVLGSPHVIEVIVVDGGSWDRTCETARRAGARVLVHDAAYWCGGGRGGQIKAGIAHARGDVVAVVHADALVPPRVFRRMIRAVNSGKNVIGGAAGCRFRTGVPGRGIRIRLGIVEWLNHVRALATGISFGDQVQFFRRRPVAGMDLFPDMPLMEDVEFSIRMRSLGRVVFLNEAVRVSARRWEKKGTGNGILILGLVALYLFQRLSGTPDGLFYYERYYGKSFRSDD